MSTKFIRDGIKFFVTDDQTLPIVDKLAPSNYIVKFHPEKGFYFELVDSFEISGKIYGGLTKFRDRIFNTFKDRENSTGVLLSGEKGSGKTLLGKMLAVHAATQGIPCILVNEAFRGSAFNKFIQDIEQPCLIMFDEFEKVYDDDEQEEMLTLLDGVFQSKKMFVLTCNTKYKINLHMRNRPGRLFYLIEFDGLSTAAIREYCLDKLNDKSYIESICKLASIYHAFNFDMLKALVEDMNRYNESPQEALKILNAKPFMDDGSRYLVTLYRDNKVVPYEGTAKFTPNQYNHWTDTAEYGGNPVMVPAIKINYQEYHKEIIDEEGNKVWGWEDDRLVIFGPRDMKSMSDDGTIVFANEAGFLVKLVKKQQAQTAYDFIL